MRCGMKENKDLNIENETKGAEKKAKKKWSTKKKFAIIHISIVLLVIFGLLFSFQIKKTVLKNGAIEYLCEKYDADKSEYELIECQTAKFYISNDAIPEIKRTNNVFKFCVDGRLFNVEYINGSYFDDYQLDDLYLWTSEYLKNNIDENILGMEISSYMIYDHEESGVRHSEDFDQNKVWNQKDIQEFWKAQKISYLIVYVDSMNNKERIAKEVLEKLGSGSQESVHLILTEEQKIEKVNNDTYEHSAAYKFKLDRDENYEFYIFKNER